MPLKLVFEQTDPCNAVLVRSDNGKLAYRSSTPSITLGKRVTKITRIDRTGLGHFVASIKWEEPVKDDSEIALYNGDWRKITTFMSQRRQFSSVRYMKCANGGDYKWIRYFQLWDLEMKECYARFEPAKFNLLSMKRLKATLDIALDIVSESSIAIQTCDTIIVSLLVMEKWRRYASLHGHA